MNKSMKNSQNKELITCILQTWSALYFGKLTFISPDISRQSFASDCFSFCWDCAIKLVCYVDTSGLL